MQLTAYLAHWATLGGLIGFALSRGRRAALLGAVLGAVTAALLMG